MHLCGQQEYKISPDIMLDPCNSYISVTQHEKPGLCIQNTPIRICTYNSN